MNAHHPSDPMDFADKETLKSSDNPSPPNAPQHYDPINFAYLYGKRVNSMEHHYAMINFATLSYESVTSNDPPLDFATLYAQH